MRLVCDATRQTTARRGKTWQVQDWRNRLYLPYYTAFCRLLSQLTAAFGYLRDHS